MNAINAAKNMGVNYNVTFRVIDKGTNKVVSEHIGHNQSTDRLLSGIGHYLKGEGVLGQGSYMLSAYVPRYISLGTMGLINQEADAEGLPSGVGEVSYTGSYKIQLESGKYSIYKIKWDGTIPSDPIASYDTKSEAENAVWDLTEQQRFADYMSHCPGYGADGYDSGYNNGREYFGLGPDYNNRADKSKTIKCELINSTFPRSPISYRTILPEEEAERPKTVDVVFSAMISTGALAQFREPDSNYVFITEAGLWADANPITESGRNGLLAAYRIIPTDNNEYDMTDPENRRKLKQRILKVGMNQVVQVIWKIQIGSIEDVTSDGSSSFMMNAEDMYYPGAKSENDISPGTVAYNKDGGFIKQ